MGCNEQTDPAVLQDDRAGGPLQFRITMASSPRLLAVVRAAISELAAIAGFKENEGRAMALAANEALCNVIRHAYKNQSDGEIDVNVQVHSDCLEFTIVDHGDPADISKFCAQPLDETSLSGRGTHMIRQIMDEVCYDHLAGANRLRLKKYLPGSRNSP
jgi:anti-sigma regulatory factor (Ser/Thr protein kinase)